MNLIKELKEQDKEKAELILPFLEMHTKQSRFTYDSKDSGLVSTIWANILNWVFNEPADDEVYTELMEHITKEFNRIENAALKWAIQHVVFTA